MALRTLSAMPWIGDSPEFDIANTVVVGAGANGSDIDLLDDPKLSRTWAAKAGGGSLAYVPIEHILKLRALLRCAFDAASIKRSPSETVLLELNRLASNAPHVAAVNGSGGLDWTPIGDDIVANVAAQTIRRLSEPSAGSIHRCVAPSCGMFFMAIRPDQRWCSSTCGSRARAARRRPS